MLIGRRMEMALMEEDREVWGGENENDWGRGMPREHALMSFHRLVMSFTFVSTTNLLSPSPTSPPQQLIGLITFDYNRHSINELAIC